MLERARKWLKENIWENEQVLVLRQRFSELDSQTQSYTLIGSFAFFLILLLGSLLYLGISSSSLKSQIAEYNDSIHYLQSSTEKMEDIRAKIREQSFDPNFRDLDRSAPLNTFTEKAAQKAFVPKVSFEITNEKQNSAAKGVTDSALDLKLNKVSLRQLVRILFYLEQSNSGIKVEKLLLDEKDDPNGFLWVTLSLHRIVELKKAGP